MKPLPIDEKLSEIGEKLLGHCNLVVVAAPGAGKTTRLPPALLTQPWCQGEVVVLEPRRLAAVAAAKHIADEQGWELGKTVGYQVRFENKLSSETRLRFVTEGILARQMNADPELKSVSAVVLDEFHERSLYTDLSVGLLRELQQLSRSDLRLIVMSATVDAENVAQFLDDCPIIEVPGTQHPVAINYAKQGFPLKTDPAWVDGVCQQVMAASQGLQPGRHVLVFLPGVGEIRRVASALSSWSQKQGLDLLPVHGSLTLAEQTRAIEPSRQSKILLATNIAETSLTIDGVERVVDSGLAKVQRFSPGQNFTELKLARVSLASATQRAGRAGRQYPGQCYRMWTKLDEKALAPFEAPEIRRSDLGEALLFLAALGVRHFANFSWLEKPPTAHLEQATAMLQNLGALNTDCALTKLGEQMARLPLSPRLSRLVVAGIELGCVELAVSIAAILSERDFCLKSFPFAHWQSAFSSDIELRLHLLDQALGAQPLHEVNISAVKRVLQIRQQLLRLAHAPAGHAARTSETISHLLQNAFVDCLCRKRDGREDQARMVGGRGVELSTKHLLGRHRLFYVLEGRDSGTAVIAELTAPTQKEWIQGASIQSQIVFDEERGACMRKEALHFRDLALEEPRMARVSAAEAQAHLPEIVVSRWPHLLAHHPTLQPWHARVEFLREHLPALNWPTFSAEFLKTLAEEVCMGFNSLEEIERQDLSVFFEQHLSAEQRLELKAQAPQSLHVPSGNHYPIHYKVGERPYVQVRLQKLFGLYETPKLARGQQPLIFHILAPNQRPVQVTSDLASFWQNGYPEVRKELRARYPKHAWPEKP